MPTALFDSHALLAIAPRALGIAYMLPASRDNQRIGTVEVVDIQGPLTSQDEGIFDSYASIRARLQQACMGDATEIVLKVNSPGGEVHGCFQLARDIRAMCEASGKPLTAFIDGQGCSAAYAIASAASRLVTAETSQVGSIGVITERVDCSEQLHHAGVKVSYITSGAKKAYGLPETQESDAERLDTQRTINNLAQMFYTLVEQHRGIPAARTAMLEGGTFVGQEAVSAGLCDEVGTLEGLFIQSTSLSTSEPNNEAQVTFAEICEQLSQMAGSEEEYAKLAAAMLATLEPQSEDSPPPEDDKPMEPDAECGPEEEMSASVKTAAALARQLESIAAENKALKARLSADAKQQFFAQHPEVSDSLKEVLESKPLEEIEAIVGAMQAKPAVKPGLGTLKTVAGKPVAMDREARELRAQMGLAPHEPTVVSTDYAQVFARARKAAR